MVVVVALAGLRSLFKSSFCPCLLPNSLCHGILPLITFDDLVAVVVAVVVDGLKNAGSCVGSSSGASAEVISLATCVDLYVPACLSK